MLTESGLSQMYLIFIKTLQLFFVTVISLPLFINNKRRQKNMTAISVFISIYSALNGHNCAHQFITKYLSRIGRMRLYHTEHNFTEADID